MLNFFAQRSRYMILPHLTGISSQLGTKLRHWAMRQAGTSCYSQVVLSSIPLHLPMDITYSFKHSLSVCIRPLSWDVIYVRLQIRWAAVCGFGTYNLWYACLHVGFCGSFSNNELIFVKNTCTNRPETWSVGHIVLEKAHVEARCGL